MTLNKRKKNSRQRGSHTHGWGSKKKHRGAGNRGGKGMAGTGKRADQLKTLILKKYGPSYYGKFGFKIPQKIKRFKKAINISELPNQEEINLTKLGYYKLLSKGIVNKKIIITVESCSQKAKQKIESAGGKVILTDKKER